MKTSFLFAASLLTTAVAFATQTLDEDFGADGLRISADSRSWTAEGLVGDNQGSIFFDIVFPDKDEAPKGQRTLVHLRTNGRLTLAFNAYSNDSIQLELTDQTKTYRYTSPENWIVRGKTYSLGVTWDGEAVRFYVNGVACQSGAQPLPLRKKDVTKLNLGPYKDGFRGLRSWSDQTTVRRLRVWNEARSPEEVAKEAGLAFRPALVSDPLRLVIPELPTGVTAPVIDGHLDEPMWSQAGFVPQIVHGNFVGRSGQLPPHFYRFAYDKDNLYVGLMTHFPGGFTCVPGVERTSSMEPEPWGAESWEFFLEIGKHIFRFGGNYIGGTIESRYPDLGAKWNGEWKYAFSKAMNIDDSVVWQGELAIPWKSLGVDGPVEGETRFNCCRSWTLPTCGTYSSLNEKGRGYTLDCEGTPRCSFGRSAAYRLVKRTDPAQGDYTEEFEISGGVAGGKIVYEADLVTRDGSLGAMRLTRTESTLKPAEIVKGSFTGVTSVPGYDAIRHTLTQNGEVVMRQVVPYDLDKRIFDVVTLYLQEKVRVTFRKPFSGTFVAVGPDGKTVFTKPSDGTLFEFAFPRQNAAGEYAFRLMKEDGSVAGEVKSEYPGIGEWEKQDKHLDWVLPPYKPMVTTKTTDGFASTLAMRTYTWAKSFLPVSLVSLDEELLAEPVEILLGDKPLACTATTLGATSKTRAEFVARGPEAENVGWLEYDGVEYNRLTVTPKAGGQTLKLRYRLKPGFDKYMNASAGGQWGAKRTEKIADGKSIVSAFPILWTGNEEKGLCFFYQSRSNWTASGKDCYTFEKGPDGFAVTVFVAKALKAGEPYTIEFGFVGSPARPLAKNYPYNTAGLSTTGPLNRPDRRPTTDVGLMDCDNPKLKCKDLGSFFGDLDEPDFKMQIRRHEWTLAHHADGTGIRPVPYTCARFLSNLYPEVRAFLPEWTFKPEFALDYTHTGHYLYECCPASSATEFFIWKYKTLLKRLPQIRGIYLDFGLVHECSNKEHGCHESMAILGQREFYRRLCVAQIEAGIEDPIVFIHSTDCVQLPAMTFVSHLFNGENIRQESSTLLHNKKDILDTFGIERFASELSTLPWGMTNAAYFPYDTLSKANGGDEETDAYSFRVGLASMGACLVHNTIQSLHRNHVGLFDKLIRVFDGFGVGAEGTKFIGYWRNPVKVVQGNGVYVSCHTDGKKVLAVISHIDKAHEDQDVEIELDPAVLGLTGALTTATDMFTVSDPDYQWLIDRKVQRKVHRSPLKLGEYGTKLLSFDGKILRYHLPYHKFGLVELK